MIMYNDEGRNNHSIMEISDNIHSPSYHLQNRKSFKVSQLLDDKELITSITALINNPKYCDTCFHVGMINTRLYNSNQSYREEQKNPLSENSLDEINYDSISEIWANRSILACRSPVFRTMLYGPWKETQDSKHIIEVNDVTSEAFFVMLEYIHTDKTTMLSYQNVLHVLYAAKKYQIEGLRKQCTTFVKDNIDANVAFTLLENTELTSLFHREDIIKTCIVYIERNARLILQSEMFCNLSKNMILLMVQNNKLNVKTELSLFEGVLKWASSEASRNGKTPTIQVLRNILADIIPHIRFSMMSSYQLLHQVQKTDILDPSHLLPLITYIGTLDDPNDIEKLGYIIEPRKPEDLYLTFKYRNDFDTNGIIYHLGTRKTKDNIFQNPYLLGEINVIMSSVYIGNETILTSRKKSLSVCNGPCLNSFIIIDFGPYISIKPTRYTLCYGTYEFLNAPRHWVLEGLIDKPEISLDIKNTPFVPIRLEPRQVSDEWIILLSHVHDVSLSSSVNTYSWPIESMGDMRFRKFRIRMTGPNASGSAYLCISGMEIYGDMYEKDH